jgi:hypothetical protein
LANQETRPNLEWASQHLGFCTNWYPSPNAHKKDENSRRVSILIRHRHLPLQQWKRHPSTHIDPRPAWYQTEASSACFPFCVLDEWGVNAWPQHLQQKLTWPPIDWMRTASGQLGHSFRPNWSSTSWSFVQWESFCLE